MSQDIRTLVAPLIAKLTDGIVKLITTYRDVMVERALMLARESLQLELEATRWTTSPERPAARGSRTARPRRTAARSTGAATTTSRRARSATGGSKARRAARAAARPASSSVPVAGRSASVRTTAARSAPGAATASSRRTSAASAGTERTGSPSSEARRPCGCGPRGRHRADCPDREQSAPAPKIAEEIGGGAKSATVRASAPFVPASAATKADRFARLGAAAAARRAAEAYG